MTCQQCRPNMPCAHHQQAADGFDFVEYKGSSLIHGRPACPKCGLIGHVSHIGYSFIPFTDKIQPRFACHVCKVKFILPDQSHIINTSTFTQKNGRMWVRV